MCHERILLLLHSELNDVRQSLAQRKTGGRYIPLKLYRSTKNNSISVTDVQTGLWCEIQAEYRYLHPFLKQTGEWRKMEEKGRPVLLKTPEMKQGTTIHLAKGTCHIVQNTPLPHTHTYLTKIYRFINLV